MFTFTPLTENLGAEVGGIDARRQFTDNERKALYSAWIKYGILLFRGQTLTPEEQVAFTENFGEVIQYTRQEFNNKKSNNILVLSNIKDGGKLIGSPVSGRVWHTDGHYLAAPPSGSLLYAIIVPPEGGDTLFANMSKAWVELPEDIQIKIESLRVIISRVQSRPYNYPDRPPVTGNEIGEWPDVAHPVVRRHPDNGARALYVGGNVPWKIENMALEDSLPLITWLQEFSIMQRFVYRHRWRAGDMILWDNRCVMHKATGYDGERYQRLMHRTTLAGDPPF